MGCLTSLLLLLSIGIFIVFDVFFWSVSWIFGLIGIFAIVAFIIAYAVSEDFSLSPRDYIRNSDWGIFCKKNWLGVGHSPYGLRGGHSNRIVCRRMVT